MIKVRKIAYHRNGICGTGFHAITFSTDKEKGTFVATVFPERGNVAVFQLDLLGQEVIEFGKNSWRGDHFEDQLRDAIRENGQI